MVKKTCLMVAKESVTVDIKELALVGRGYNRGQGRECGFKTK